MPDEEPSVLRQLARLSTIGVSLVAATSIGLRIGYALGLVLGTSHGSRWSCTLRDRRRIPQPLSGCRAYRSGGDAGAA